MLTPVTCSEGLVCKLQRPDTAGAPSPRGSVVTWGPPFGSAAWMASPDSPAEQWGEGLRPVNSAGLRPATSLHKLVLGSKDFRLSRTFSF